MTYQFKHYEGTPKHCCLMMDLALDEGYLGQGLGIDLSGGGLKVTPPYIHGQKLAPRGKAQKPNIYINHCPWCGAAIEHKPQQELGESAAHA